MRCLLVPSLYKHTENVQPCDYQVRAKDSGSLSAVKKSLGSGDALKNKINQALAARGLKESTGASDPVVVTGVTVRLFLVLFRVCCGTGHAPVSGKLLSTVSQSACAATSLTTVSVSRRQARRTRAPASP